MDLLAAVTLLWTSSASPTTTATLVSLSSETLIQFLNSGSVLRPKFCLWGERCLVTKIRRVEADDTRME